MTTEIERIVGVRLLERAEAVSERDEFRSVCDAVLAREIDPWAAADQLLASGG